MPEAMTIASATSDGVPSARLVVLRGLRRAGTRFFWPQCPQRISSLAMASLSRAGASGGSGGICGFALSRPGRGGYLGCGSLV
jgi:hypothetical protein